MREINLAPKDVKMINKLHQALSSSLLYDCVFQRVCSIVISLKYWSSNCFLTDPDCQPTQPPPISLCVYVSTEEKQSPINYLIRP